MKDSIFEILSAYANSARFQAIVRGTRIKLPTGQWVDVRLEGLDRAIRPKGLRLSKYIFVASVRVGEATARGYGEASTVTLASQKALAEGFERAVMRSLRGTSFQSLSSNGWAAHLSFDLAEAAARDELFERDSALTHWLTETPMTEVTMQGAPNWLSKWVDEELSCGTRFKTLRVLVHTVGHLPVVTTVFQDGQGLGVLSHATGRSLEKATHKALVETCRIAQLATDKFSTYQSNTLVGPSDHAMYYAHTAALPPWIFGQKVQWCEAKSVWRSGLDDSTMNRFPPHEFHKIVDGPLCVGVCKSDQIQNLYFGKTEVAYKNGHLNLSRSRAVRGDDFINFTPHCVA